ncbi:hypothetical protein [Roseimaritima ulvae]|uniref:Uncharacterized protein n=1 Tax=Roseimaritima ulvae TaxID=980254 RepID=A0A5B9R1P6_9BACT|nr:hypothetical protein [Roseimaritima ulvae]QEG43336.1 hypothetical protein UC8_53830 [Roseimaritima ulvae]
MTASNRATRISKLQSALKKHYKPLPSSSRPVMEHLLYACLLEGAPSELADEGLAKLEQQYFDWNEVRVTTIAEISDVLSNLPNSMAAATRLKRVLQSAFEAFYSFELDDMKKQNLGKAVEQFEALPGMTPFVLSYVTQQGLGGHSIPVDNGGLWIMFACGIINETEMASRKVPGLERAIPKNKGMEFGSLLQQASAAWKKNAKDKTVAAVVSAVDKNGAVLLASSTPIVKSTASSTSAKDTQKTKKASGKPAADKAKPASAGKKAADTKATTKKATAKKSASKDTASKKTPAKKATAKSSKAPAKKLTKRKPR